jgi:hypothetical protein
MPHATAFLSKSQASAPDAYGAAMADDDEDGAVITAVAISLTAHAAAQAREIDTVPHATTPLPRSQAPAPTADSAAMADDNDAAIATNVDEEGTWS